MARFLSLSAALLVSLFLSHSCLAQLDLPQHQFFDNLLQQQKHRLRAKTPCRIDRLNAREPTRKFDYEAGSSEVWDSDAEEFECAGIEFSRHVIQPKGLLLPHYHNAPQILYVVEGSGIHGTVVPGCAETYESGGSSSREEGESKFMDRHQKLERFRRGDVLALTNGLTHWAYNDGEKPIVLVALRDVANDNTQLDLRFRKFFLAGNPEESQSQQGLRKRGEQEKGNIFNGFDEEILAEAFNVDTQTARKLKSREDKRGIIVRAETLRLNLPEYQRSEEREQEREHGGGRRGGNGLEETLCSLKIRENIDHPSRADQYNPRGGRLSSVNGQTLPILSHLQLSAQKGVLYKNAMLAPHWSTNSHCAMYVTSGSARVQVVGSKGKSVFDGEVSEGQLLVIPQNFVVVKKASEQGFEWINLRTNGNAMSSQLAGRLSAIRAMPVEVLTNAYQISKEDARNLKFNREEASVFSAGSRSRSGGYA